MAIGFKSIDIILLWCWGIPRAWRRSKYLIELHRVFLSSTEKDCWREKIVRRELPILKSETDIRFRFSESKLSTNNFILLFQLKSKKLRNSIKYFPRRHALETPQHHNNIVPRDLKPSQYAERRESQSGSTHSFLDPALNYVFPIIICRFIDMQDFRDSRKFLLITKRKVYFFIYAIVLIV